MAVAKRIIVYILVAAFSVVLIIPVSAAAGNGANDQIINAFPPSGEFFPFDSGEYFGLTYTPSFYPSSVGERGGIEWYIDPLNADYLFFSVSVGESLTDEYFDFDNIRVQINGYDYECEYVWSSGNEFYYSVFMDGIIAERILVYYFTDGFEGLLTINSCFFTKSQLQPAAYVSMELAGLMLNKHDGYSVDTFIFDSRTGMLPMFMTRDYPGSESSWVLADGLASITFADLSPYPTDSMYINIFTAGSLINSGAYLVDEDGNRVQNIDVLAEFTGSPLDPTQRFHDRPLNAYLLYIDLSGIKLRGYDLVVTYGINEVQFSSSQYDTGIYTYVQSAFVQYTTENVPWYTRIGMIVDKLVIGISQAFGDIFFDGASEELAGEVEEAEDELNSLTPEVNAGDLIDSYEDEYNRISNDSGFVAGANVIGVLWDAVPWEFLLFVGLFALAGYLIFGKR